MKGSLFILLSLILGILIGYFDLSPEFITQSPISLYILYLILFLVGVGLGFDIKALLVLREMKINILLVPVGILLSSLAFAAITALALGRDPLEGLIIASGVSYYSLASILVTETGRTELASLTLLVNMLREIYTLTFSFFIVKYGTKLAPVMTAGAAAVDTCLPSIAQFGGERYALIGLFSGTVLTIAVPIVLPFLLSFL